MGACVCVFLCVCLCFVCVCVCVVCDVWVHVCVCVFVCVFVFCLCVCVCKDVILWLFRFPGEVRQYGKCFEMINMASMLSKWSLMLAVTRLLNPQF